MPETDLRSYMQFSYVPLTHKNPVYTLYLPAVYKWFIGVTIKPASSAPKIHIGYSGILGNNTAITFLSCSFNFLLKALFKFFDFSRSCSNVNFLPVKEHSYKIELKNKFAHLLPKKSKMILTTAILWGNLLKFSKINSGNGVCGISTSGKEDVMILQLFVKSRLFKVIIEFKYLLEIWCLRMRLIIKWVHIFMITNFLILGVQILYVHCIYLYQPKL